MKCPNCGAPVSVEELRCPFCGTENPEAVELMKQREAEAAETERRHLEAVEGYKKTKVRADLQESIAGSRKASKFLNLLISISLTVFMGATAVEMFFYMKDQVRMDSFPEPRSGTYAEKMTHEMLNYEDLHSYQRLIEEMDDFYADVQQNKIPSLSTCERVARCLASAWNDSHRSYNLEHNPELMMQCQTYVTNVLTNEFQLDPRYTWFLSSGTYLETEQAEDAGKDLRNAYMEVHK